MPLKPDVYRTTKCFTVGTNGYPGGYPRGYLKWLQEMGWWGERRIHLCAGGVKKQDPEGFTVDIKPESGADLIADAADTHLEAESFDCALIDPPYNRELADKLYGTGDAWKSINAFAREGARLVVPGGFVITLSYEVPKQIAGCTIVAVCGIYQIINTCNMRCLTVFRKV
jgi:hypothetical protein